MELQDLDQSNAFKFIIHTMHKQYFTYIAKCADDSLYTGYCVDLQEREDKHNLGEGAKYTRNRRPIKIVYSESFSTRSEAMKREWEIKKMRRSEKLKLIAENQ